MKLIPCPRNGLRPEDEFVRGGEIHPMPPENAADNEWRDYLFFHDNTPGEIWEWWCHTPSGVWFAALRNTATDEIIKTKSAEDAE